MAYKKFFPAKRYKWVVIPLKMIKEMLLKRRDNEKDNMILITGARGDGKSTFTGKVLFLFEDFKPFENMVYSKEAMFKLIKQKKGYIWADEAVVNSAKGNTMTRANKLLFEASTINRDNYNIVFFCMPYIEDFDTKILQYVSMWIHIDSRGLGILMLPSNRGIFGKRRWDLNAMKKIYDEFLQENQNLTHVPYWIFDNFRGYIRFGKLTPEQDKIIKEVKALRKNENMDKELAQEVEVEVKQFDNYILYASKKISEAVIHGQIRSIEQFNKFCQDLKTDPLVMIKKCDYILKKNGIDKNTKAKIKEFYNEDIKIQF